MSKKLACFETKGDIYRMKTLSRIKLETAAEKGYTVTSEGFVIFKNHKKKLNHTHGYPNFSIRLFDGRRGRVPVHRFVAFLKYGNIIFNKGIQVRHLNGNKDDNSHDNIAIGTQSENQMDIPEEIRISRSKFAGAKNRILSDDKVTELMIDRSAGATYKALMEKYCISSKGTISYLVTSALYNEKRSANK